MQLENLRELILSKKKPLLVLAVLLVIDVGLYLYISTYQENSLTGLRQSWLAKRRHQAGGDGGNEAAVYSQGVKDLAVFYDRIPPKKDFARVLGDIFELASNNGLALKSIKYKPEGIKSGNIMSYVLGLELSGNYAGVKSMIADVQRMKEIVTIDGISLAESDPTQENVSLKLQVTAYFRTDGK